MATLLRRRGYHGAGLNEVVAGSGAPRGSVYHHYPQGKDAIAFLEKLVVGDIAALKNGTGSLSVFTNEAGGIIDGTVITKVDPLRPSQPCGVQPVFKA